MFSPVTNSCVLAYARFHVVKVCTAQAILQNSPGSLSTVPESLREIFSTTFSHLRRLVVFSYFHPLCNPSPPFSTPSTIFGQCSLILGPFDLSNFSMVLETNSDPLTRPRPALLTSTKLEHTAFNPRSLQTVLTSD